MVARTLRMPTPCFVAGAVAGGGPHSAVRQCPPAGTRRSDRDRKLLAHRRQIDKLAGQIQTKGLTIVPTRMYFNDESRVKVEVAPRAVRNRFDKRHTIKERDWRAIPPASFARRSGTAIRSTPTPPLLCSSVQGWSGRGFHGSSGVLGPASGAASRRGCSVREASSCGAAGVAAGGCWRHLRRGRRTGRSPHPIDGRPLLGVGEGALGLGGGQRRGVSRSWHQAEAPRQSATTIRSWRSDGSCHPRGRQHARRRRPARPPSWCARG